MLDFWIGVFQDVLANFASAALVAIALILLAFVRFSGLPQRILRRIFPRRPDCRVMTAPLIPESFEPIRNTPSPFIPLPDHERHALVAFYNLLNGSSAHDGRSVRLDRLHPRVEVSEVGFFDLLTTNMTAYPANVPVVGLYRQLRALVRWVSVYPILRKVVTGARAGGARPRSVDEALANSHMANVVAVSVFLVDSKGRVAVVRRQQKLAISSGAFAATGSGTVSVDDLAASDPFLQAARRELQEETGLNVESLRLDGVVMPLQKMQPIFLYSGGIGRTWEEVLPVMQTARDFHREIQHVYALRLDEPASTGGFLAKANLTDAAAYHLWLLAEQAAGRVSLLRAWRRARLLAALSPLQLDRYLLRE